MQTKIFSIAFFLGGVVKGLDANVSTALTPVSKKMVPIKRTIKIWL